LIREIALALIVAGAVLAAVGAILYVSGRLPGVPLGNLPGDVRWERRGITVYLPIATCLLLSMLLTLILRLLHR
jgi:hypothetical protein